MTDRLEIEQLLERLYGARIAGQLDMLCGLFSPDARFRISGAGGGKAIAVAAEGTVEIRTWLSMLLRTFRLTNHRILAILIDGSAAAVHWQADVHSKVTGAVVATEFVDLVEVREAVIVSYREFLVPC